MERMGWSELPEELKADQIFTARKCLHNDFFYLSVQNSNKDDQAIVDLI
ncbi:hypothetical protein [Exiguobacterium sp. ZOR0005]|nr:hypothetical protein [Exiguobacterium sp. ZOR0005]